MSTLTSISLLDLLAPNLSPRTQLAISDGALNPDDFKRCFEAYPEVMVAIMRMSTLSDASFMSDASEQEYLRGSQDLARQIYALSIMKTEDD